MRKKNLFLVVLAMVLVCAISVTGTLAYLTDKANDGAGVINTFVASGGGVIKTEEGVFTLQEHAYTQKDDGTYEEGDLIPKGVVTGNAYKLLPGTNVPKDPFITLTGKTEAPAYLYLEVVESGSFVAYDENEQEGSDVTYAITDSWEKLDDVTGANGGTVYVYKYQKDGADTYIVDDKTFTEENTTVSILEDDQIVAGSNLNIAKESELKLEFYAYLAQSTVMAENGDGELELTSDKATVYTTCFTAASTGEPEEP